MTIKKRLQQQLPQFSCAHWLIFIAKRKKKKKNLSSIDFIPKIPRLLHIVSNYRSLIQPILLIGRV